MSQRMMRKGQTATEYLVILAVVIILALIVVGVLGGFPGLGSSSKSRTNELYWQQADIAIVEHTFTQDPNSVSLKLRNNLPHDITLALVQINSTTLWQGQKNIASGSSIVIDDDDLSSGVACVSGEDYSWDVLIAYSLTSQVEDELYYFFEGEGHKLTGSCALG